MLLWDKVKLLLPSQDKISCFVNKLTSNEDVDVGLKILLQRSCIDFSILDVDFNKSLDVCNEVSQLET